MSYSSKPKCLTYPDATRAFADENVRDDINDACARLGQAMSKMMERFDSVAKQMHTLDLQRLAAPLKPRWDALSKEFRELLWQYRNNAGVISGRLKMFCTSVLPIAARNLNGRSRQTYEETVKVLQAFMSISAEHAALTRTLLDRALAFLQQMVAFHAELAKLVSRQSTTGQREIYELAVKLSDLEAQVGQICILNLEVPRPDVTHVTYSTFKIVSSSGRRPGRSKIPQQRMTVLIGLAPNGGLYIPEHIPKLPENWLTEWKDYSFVDLSVAVLSLYISPEEISKEELRSLVQKSYSTFRHPDVTPLHKLDDKTFVLELFHGPTFAFKDVALQLLGNLFEFFLLRRNAKKGPEETPETLTVVGATSGDTGSAAIYGLRGKENVSIFILHPKGRVSPIQEAQMTTVTDSNVHNIAVRSTFDDCQDIVKALFADKEFNAKHHLGAVNSINWARILAQTVYYFLSFFHIRSQLPAGTSADDIEIQYVVPTGNFGDILAAYYARKMGLPVGKLVVATNANDILARFWKHGKYEKVDSESKADVIVSVDASGVKETLSPAMDILVSSNFERLLWYLAYEHASGNTDEEKRQEACATLDGWMNKVKTNGRVEIPVQALETARKDFIAARVSDEETLATIKAFFDGQPSYVADPHTAVGLATARRLQPENADNVRQIVLSTAHPAKFSEAVSRALEGSPKFDFDRDVFPPELRGLLEKERRVIDVERPDINLVKAVIESFAKQ
ncbi:hypothetical protein EST38_g8940 [Candolleomyces aberdarensis]|uniref:threonine synthase n=1 Tax=Candolleomyces aberdarensis TaxID=2316362 RepID=A0A4Q2DE44_9AGAR|nr:hypothetical protein EST38_g8940 [Candolleomyces aberdarensis]